MSLLKKSYYSILWALFLFQQKAFAWINFGTEKARDLSWGNVTDGEQAIKNLILLFLSFVTLVAVIIVIWSGFKVLVGWEDEKALEKAKKTIINIVVGIIIMWIAYAAVTWVINALRTGV